MPRPRKFRIHVQLVDVAVPIHKDDEPRDPTVNLGDRDGAFGDYLALEARRPGLERQRVRDVPGRCSSFDTRARPRCRGLLNGIDERSSVQSSPVPALTQGTYPHPNPLPAGEGALAPPRLLAGEGLGGVGGCGRLMGPKVGSPGGTPWGG